MGATGWMKPATEEIGERSESSMFSAEESQEQRESKKIRQKEDGLTDIMLHPFFHAPICSFFLID